MPHLFSPGVIKIYNLPVLDAASKQQTLAGEIRSSVPDTSSSPSPIYPPPVHAQFKQLIFMADIIEPFAFSFRLFRYVFCNGVGT